MPRNRTFPIGTANPDGTIEPLRYTIASALEGQPIPSAEWLVGPWYPWHQVTMVSGDGGVGKSLLALQLMASSALSRPWLGLETKPVKCFGMFAEDDDAEIHRRLSRILQHENASFGDLEDRLAWWSCLGADTDLARFPYEGGIEPTMAFFRLQKSALDFGAQLVVIDSLHDVFTGNENNRVQARQFIRMLQGLAEGVDGSVVLTAHPSRAGRSDGSGESGSTAWNNAVRSRLYLARPTDDDHDTDARILTRKKSNYSSINDELKLEWKDGVLVPAYTPTGALLGMERRACEDVFLDLLRRVDREGRPVTCSDKASNFAPKVFARTPAPDRHGYGKRDFAQAMERLFSQGKIEMQEYRKQDRKLGSKIARTGDEK